MKLLFLLLAVFVVLLTVKKAIARSRKMASLQQSLDSLSSRSEEVESLAEKVLKKLDQSAPELDPAVFDMAAQDALNACKEIVRLDSYNSRKFFFEYDVDLDRETSDLLKNLAVYYYNDSQLSGQGLSYQLKDEFWFETADVGKSSLRVPSFHQSLKGIKKKKYSVDRSHLQSCFSEVGSYAS